MKIGILGCFYNCDDLLPHVLAPWLELKNEGYDIVIGAINVQFKEYAELGYPDEDHATRAILRQYREQALIDTYIEYPTPLKDEGARNVLLDELKKFEPDIVWIVDGDEIYTKEQILNIISFVERSAFDYYHLYLKNIIFDETEWKDDFFPPRIFRTNRHGGLERFTWENELLFKDGTHANNLVPGIVPKSVAHIFHTTWRKKEAAQKIEYQKKRFGYCIYRFSEHGRLEPDPAYFALHKIPYPEVLADGSIARSPKPIIDIIFRSHTAGNFREKAARVTDDLGGKTELSLRALRSLVQSLLVLERVNDYEIRLTLVDDHSDEQFLQSIQSELLACPFEVTVIPLSSSGNEASMEFVLQYAKSREQDFIYFVEDDYLHEPTALLEMMRDYDNFSKNLGRKNIGLFPVDYPDFYLPQLIAETRIVPGSRRHWRISYTTTCTFFLPRSLFIEQWEWFKKLPEVGMAESESINVVWQNHAILFSPIPTLAYHMHQEQGMPPYSNWRVLWNRVNTPLYAG